MKREVFGLGERQMNKSMEYIYKIYQEGGFSKAAKALYIS